jgi:hypothetical protein
MPADVVPLGWGAIRAKKRRYPQAKKHGKSPTAPSPYTIIPDDVKG